MANGSLLDVVNCLDVGEVCRDRFGSLVRKENCTTGRTTMR